MPVTCAICRKTWIGENIRKYAVPLEPEIRQWWEEICGMEFTASSRVCEKHFAPSDFKDVEGAKRRRLNAGSVPSLFLQRTGAEGNDMSFGSENNYEDVAVEESLQVAAKYVDCCTQTEYEVVEAGTWLENMNLRKKIEELQAENTRLQKKISELESLDANLKEVFTEGQIKRLRHRNTHPNWCWDDIAYAITLHAAGPRAYRHLRQIGFPLPCPTVLHTWVKKVGFEEGILTQIIDVIKNVNELPPEDKLCVISFDEMKVAACYEQDSFTNCIRKPSNFVQVAIVRGLKASWKQPVFYGFDTKMTKSILFEIFNKLYEAGFTVVAMVSDMGSTNRALWKELNVSVDHTWFPHPANKESKVFVFADVPHLLKLVRNHFIDSGFLFDGKLITVQTVKQVMNYTSTSDASIAFKLSESHLYVSNTARQKVKLATQLLSNTTASAIRRCYAIGHELYNPCECADFIQLVNDWFDIFNSKLSTANSMETKKPFGLALSHQKSILDRMSQVMSKVIVPNKSTFAPFQKGILMSNKSIDLLYNYLNTKYGFDYIITYRLNQDILENFFGNIRSKGGLYDHPSPMHFKFRLRKYLFARNTEILQASLNVEIDQTPWLNLATATKLSENSVEEDPRTISEDLFQQLVEDDFFEPEKENEEEISEVEEDALENISGFIIRKLNLGEEFGSIGPSRSFTWVDQVSRGGLYKPKPQFLNELKKLEEVFRKFNGKEISTIQHLAEVMLKAVDNIQLSEEIIKMFFKLRINIRIRNLNKRLLQQKIKQKIVGNKKLLKIKL